MGRRWRSKQPTTIPVDQEPDMIEHSINKHSAIITAVNQASALILSLPGRRPQQPSYSPSTKTTWPKHKCLAYIEEKKKAGFIIGAEITTKYGNPGKIASYRDIPADGLSFFGLPFPNVYSIERPLMGDNGVWYNETELTLTK